MDNQKLEAAAAAAERDPETQVAIENARFTAGLYFGKDLAVLDVRGGKVRCSLAKGETKTDFQVKAPASAWEEFCAGPTIEANTLFGMALQGHLSKTGKMKSEFEYAGDRTKLWANFHAMSTILEHIRDGRSA